MRKVTSKHLKVAVMSYFRFKRGWLCATEYRNADVAAINNHGELLEVEIKVCKHDLWVGEANKNKHPLNNDRYDTPNLFYVCVPTSLIDEAIRWAKQYPMYGVIEYGEFYPPVSIRTSAIRIHSRTHDRHKSDLAMRVCSENINLMQKEVK